MDRLAYRERLLSLLDALPQALPILGPWQRSYTPQTALAIEHLVLEFRLQAQAFCLVHSLAPELQAHALLECRFGLAPSDRAAEVYRRLLGINSVAARLLPAGFGLDKTTGEVLLCTPLSLDRATPHALAERIASDTLLAASWREHFFLNAAPSIKGF